MAKFFESGSYVLPSQVRSDIEGRLKGAKAVKSLELHLKGGDLQGAKEFSRLLLALKRKGVRISHELSIKLEFPKSIQKDQVLELVENMPKPKNGSVKVKVELGG